VNGSFTSLGYNLIGNPTPGAPSKLVIQTEPLVLATAGVAFNPQPVIDIEDPYGNFVTGASTTRVTASTYSGTRPLSGTKTVIASRGIAKFKNLSDSNAGTIVLVFKSGKLTEMNSSSIVVHAGGSPAVVKLSRDRRRGPERLSMSGETFLTTLRLAPTGGSSSTAAVAIVQLAAIITVHGTPMSRAWYTSSDATDIVRRKQSEARSATNAELACDKTQTRA
jgi:hypothetical protein